MWPDLFGPGWLWGMLTAAGLLGLFVALIWFFGDFRPPRRAADPIQVVWRRYECGDLTHQEFERFRRAMAEFAAERERWRAMDPRRVPASTLTQERRATAL